MSIRVRLIVLIVLVGTAPVLIASLWTTRFIEDLATTRGAAVLEDVGKTIIYDDALTMAVQVQSYLARHPELALSDMETLQRDSELASIAVQPIGRTGYTALIDRQGYTRFHVNRAMIGENVSVYATELPEFWAIFSVALAGANSEGYYDWIEPDGTVRPKYAVLLPIENTPFIAVATTYMDEFAQSTAQLRAELAQVARLTRQRFLIAILVTGGLSVGLAVGLGARLVRPLQAMAQSAARVIEGDWDAVQPLPRRDEIGDLSRALHLLTTRLRDLVQHLEQQVVERTERLERRTRYLEATTRVARNAAAVLDMKGLPAHVTALIAEEFNFYHVGLFLVDATQSWLELRAASSVGGQRMLARNYRLPLNSTATLVQVLGQGEPRVFRDTGGHAVRFDNPELPETHAQVVFPLRAQGQIIGVLDVQSRAPDAFGSEEVAILQTLAEQVAVAISNARLFRQTQESAEEERRLRGELELEAWRELLSEHPDLAYRSTAQGVSPVAGEWRPEAIAAISAGEAVIDEAEGVHLAVPIRVGGQVIGVIEGCKSLTQGAWTAPESALLNVLTEQLNATIDRARLYQDTQRRAAHERLVGQVSASIRQELELEAVLRTTVDQIQQALGLEKATIRLVGALTGQHAETVPASPISAKAGDADG